MKKIEMEISVNFFLFCLMIHTIATIVVLVERKENIRVRNPEEMELLGLGNSGVQREDTTNPKKEKLSGIGSSKN